MIIGTEWPINIYRHYLNVGKIDFYLGPVSTFLYVQKQIKDTDGHNERACHTSSVLPNTKAKYSLHQATYDV